MPKRKRRGSGRSMGSLKSPRKGLQDVSVEEDENKTEPVVFKFGEGEDEQEMLLDACEVLCCINGEDVEGENQPFDKAKLSLTFGSGSPSKRSSPLSLAYPDNVLEKPEGLAGDTDQVEANRTPQVVKNEEARVTSSARRNLSARRSRVVNEEPRAESRLEAQEEPMEVDEKDVKSLEATKKLPVSSQTPSQPTDRIPLPEAVFRILDDYHLDDIPEIDPPEYRKTKLRSQKQLCIDVLYELDDVDIHWLDVYNRKYRTHRHDGLNLGVVEEDEMALLLDRFEKEEFYELQNSGMGKPGESDEDAVCCICFDGESDNSNQIIFCDMCNIPVHQDCFGVPFIPEGIWLCRRCSDSPYGEIECIFCPNKEGAFKRTVDGRWSHVVCALWIPEVRFSNPTLKEPVDDIDDIPAARWKLTCFICKKKGVGACIQCHLRSCVIAFHVTCAQSEGLSLKMDTRGAGIRLKASCDKHTPAQEMEDLKQKMQTISKVLNEKRTSSSEDYFPSIPADRIESITKLVTFPGRKQFVRRINALWKLKRRIKGGSALLSDPESCWIEGMKVPPEPDPIERPRNEELEMACYHKMIEDQSDYTHLQEYIKMIQDHSEATLEDRKLQHQIFSIECESYHRAGVDVYLGVLEKLRVKDKHGTFAEPVTEEMAPGYSKIITSPMDLTTMRKKVTELQYSSVDDFEADFNLMISNCMTFNKKSTPYHKDAVRLQEFSHNHALFEEARRFIQQRSLPARADLKPDPTNSAVADPLNHPLSLNEVKYRPPLQGVLISILEELARHDKQEIFAEPVDTEANPQYLEIIEQPMDFSTIRNKVNTNQYSQIEDMEADFFLMIENCLNFNEKRTKIYKMGEKLGEIGKSVFVEAKRQRYMPGIVTPPQIRGPTIQEEKNNNYKTDTADNINENGVLSEDEVHRNLSDLFKRLVDLDDEEIFNEPVTEDIAPGYSEIIDSPMDFSLMEKKLETLSYTCLEDLEKDFNLMIDNCKRYNAPGTKFYNYAIKVKRAGTSLINSTRKRMPPRKTENVREKGKNCDDNDG